MDLRKAFFFGGIALSILGALAIFATAPGTGQQGQIEMGAYGVGILLLVQALYGIAQLED